jgi:hypothetical protein
MKRTIFTLLSLVIILFMLSGCSHERVYYHNKHGKVKHVRAQKTPAWYATKEKGYSKHARRTMRRWDRNIYR